MKGKKGVERGKRRDREEGNRERGKRRDEGKGRVG